MRFKPAAAKWAGAFVALALLFAPLAAFAQTSEPLQFPELTGRVVDRANLLSAAQREELTQKLEELEKKTTAQFVVVTLTSLSGRTIEEYGYQLGRHWGIGQKATNNGALLIVAPNERKVRIEVGYGAEGVLPDAVTSLIIQRVIIPKFRANDYAGGIVAGADEIIKVLSGAGDEWKNAPKNYEDAPWWIDVIVIGFFLIPFLLVPLTIFLTIRSFYRNTLAAMKKQKGEKKSLWDALTTSSGSSSSSWGSSSSSSSWSSSSSSGGFSGGGGSFGGGGSSGSW
jgi:uncharacterized protein